VYRADKPGPHLEAPPLELVECGQALIGNRAWPYDAHIAPEYVPQLGQLVKPADPQPGTQRSEPREFRPPAVPERTEAQSFEWLTVLAQVPIATENRRTGEYQYRQGNQRHHRRRHQE